MAQAKQSFLITMGTFFGLYGYARLFGFTPGTIVPDPPRVVDPTGLKKTTITSFMDTDPGTYFKFTFDDTTAGDDTTFVVDEDTFTYMTYSIWTGELVTIDWRDMSLGGDLSRDSSTYAAGSAGGSDIRVRGKRGHWVTHYASGAARDVVFYQTPLPIKNLKNPGGDVPLPRIERTATTSAVVSREHIPRPARGKKAPDAEIIFDVCNGQTGTFDLTLYIEGYDAASDTYYPILNGANVTAENTLQRLKIGPSVASVSNVSSNDVLPHMWRMRVVHGNATGVSYSVEYRL